MFSLNTETNLIIYCSCCSKYVSMTFTMFYILYKISNDSWYGNRFIYLIRPGRLFKIDGKWSG